MPITQSGMSIYINCSIIEVHAMHTYIVDQLQPQRVCLQLNITGAKSLVHGHCEVQESLHKASTAQQQINVVVHVPPQLPWTHNHLTMALALLPRLAGKKRAWYPLFVHALKGTIVLYPNNHDVITYTYCCTVHTFSDQQWSSFNHSCYFQCPQMARYF